MTQTQKLIHSWGICFIIAMCVAGYIRSDNNNIQADTEKREQSLDPLSRLTVAIYAIESSSGTDRRMDTPGPDGELGPLQVTDICFADCLRIVGYNQWAPQDRLDLYKSAEMFAAYCFHYYPYGSMEEMARLWHRGPSKTAQYDRHGDRYWDKVRKHL